MEKECIGCGAYFETEKTTIKYCEQCRESGNPTKIQYKYNRAEVSSLAKYGTGQKREHPNRVCEFCNKEYKQYPGMKARFCSKDCSTEYDIAHAECRNCGTNLMSIGIREPNWQRFFCNDKCKEELSWKVARKNGRVKVCPECKKEYINKDSMYCSKACYKNALANGNYVKKKEAERKEVFVMRRCFRCNNQFHTSEIIIKKYGFPCHCEDCRSKLGVSIEQSSMMYV